MKYAPQSWTNVDSGVPLRIWVGPFRASCHFKHGCGGPPHDAGGSFQNFRVLPEWMRGVQILDLGGIYEGQIQVPVILAVVYEGSFQKLRGPSKGSSQTCCGPQMVDVGGYTQTRGPSRWMWVYPPKPPKFYSSVDPQGGRIWWCSSGHTRL